jgi:phosphatidylglycerol---prolipoprotein diacylglyceryl transferase
MLATLVPGLLATFPAPPGKDISIGPFDLRAYGLMIALGVIAAVWMFGRRLEARGVGTRDDASAIALWAVGAGVVGARLYHVITDWHRFSDDLSSIPAIWEGGLGIPGGLLLGVAVGVYVARRRGLSPAVAATCAAPGIALAQAIGRWGNWFNQELFGKPTDLPWALEVDPQYVPPGYPVGTTFHPTFLYESLWCLGLCLVLLWIDRRWNPAPGRLMGMYVVGYGVGRFWIEGLRIDEADEVLGLRWNQWMALAAVVGGLIYLWATRDRTWPEPAPAADGDTGDTVDRVDHVDHVDTLDQVDVADPSADDGVTDARALADDQRDPPARPG